MIPRGKPCEVLGRDTVGTPALSLAFIFGHLPVPPVNAFSTGQTQDGPDPARTGRNGPLHHPVSSTGTVRAGPRWEVSAGAGRRCALSDFDEVAQEA